MAFVYPQLLWLLLLAPLIAYAGYRTGGVRRLRVALLRAALLSALVLAVSRPIVNWNAESMTTVVVIDLGPGISNESLSAPLEFIRNSSPKHTIVVAFSNRTSVVTDRSLLASPAGMASLRKQLSEPLWADDAKGGGANLPAAMQLAASQIPNDGRGEIRLYASGLSDHGDAAAEAYRLAERGITVKAVPLDRKASELPPVMVQRVTLPTSARAGETVTADVEVDAAVASTVRLRVTAGEHAVVVSAEVKPGSNRVAVPLSLSKSGLSPVRASAWTGDEPKTAAAEVFAAIYIEPASRILLVQDESTDGLADGLAALLGDSAQIVPVRPEDLADQLLGAAGAVVLADLPADRLPIAAQDKLRQAVHNGTGLLLTGAAKSFGPGGYDRSSLARLLPVRMPQQMESIDPSTTLVLIIDSSGSMKGDRIDLAKEVSRLAISHLRPQDKVGIVEFYGGKRWAAPIQSAANLSIIHRALARLTAGGGTKLYPAVEEAAFTLRNVHTRSKHVLILSDGFVEDAPFAALVRQMAGDGIAVSTIQVGSDGGGPNMMPDIARWGAGRFYTVPDQFALPDITLKQPQVMMLSPVVRTPSEVVAADDALVRRIASEAWKPIQGYVRTVAKPTAEVLLKTAGGDPLLTRWRYGAGFVAALPTQLGSVMTDGLADQPQFAKLCGALLRQLSTSRGTPLRVTTAVRPAGVEIDVRTVDGSASLATRTLKLSLADETGRIVQTTEAEAMSPGRWNILLPGVTAGAYAVTVTLVGTDADGNAGVGIAPPASVYARMNDPALLDQIAGFGPLANERAALLPQNLPVFIELQKALAVTAVVLLLILLAVRRWPLVSRKSY